MEEPKPAKNDDGPSTAKKAAGSEEALLPGWEKPKFRVKMAYAIPSIVGSALVGPMLIELKIFYTDTVLISAGLLAFAIALSRCLDAVTDPLMGWISDHTSTRWGRRKHWIPIGVPLAALFYWLMFAPPRTLTGGGEALLWAGATFCLFFLFETIWYVPYTGLGLELSPSYDDRTQLFGYRTFFVGLGSILGYGALIIFRTKMSFADDREMLSTFTGVLAILLVLIMIVPVIGIKENPKFVATKRTPLVPGIRRALRNRPFQIVLIVVIIGTIPNVIPLLVMPYFVKYVIVVGAKWRLYFAGLYMLASFVSVPFWIYVALRIGKLRAWIVATVIGIVTCLLIFTVGRGETGLMLVLEILRGFAFGALLIVTLAITADIVDYDELKTGTRREAQFGSFLSLVRKLIGVLGSVIPLVVLGVVGYDPTTAQLGDNSILAIRVLYSFVPAAMHVIVIYYLLRYPISREVHVAIQQATRGLREGKQVQDPITGLTILPPRERSVEEDMGWYLDNFSLQELNRMAEKGVKGLVTRVQSLTITSAVIGVGTLGTSFWLLIGSVSRSQEDQIRQGIATGLVMVGGVAFTAMIFHLLRIGAAKRMAAEPVDAEIIREHIRCA